MEFTSTDFVEVGKLSVSQKIMSTEKLINELDHTGVKKISVDVTGEYGIEREYGPLSVITVDSGTYQDQIQGTEKELSDALYLVETDNINAQNRRVINVGAPQSDNDAVNKAYVDVILGQIPRTCESEEPFHD